MLPLFSSFILKGIPVKNRVIMPPMVCFGYTGEDGMVTSKSLDHYCERAEGGAGIIVTEATCVLPEGRIRPCQLGIWSDQHIQGLNKISGIVKGFGALSLIQLHHAGLISPPSVTLSPGGPSVDPNIPGSHALSIEEIQRVKTAFIDAAIRAQHAGFDGVQIHGAHGYLLNQFASTHQNCREDDYGGDIPSRLKLSGDILKGIREKCGEHFVIAYRMGANSPTLEEGIEIAQLLETYPIDLLDVSHGGSIANLSRPPKDFPYNGICYSGTVIKKFVKIPVSVVNEIHTPERANFLIEHKLADFVNIGRPQLADPHWVSKAQYHEEMIVKCLNCKPKCKWYVDSTQCPAFQIRVKHQV